jgi:guanine nucleotide-binding protein subunit alpha
MGGCSSSEANGPELQRSKEIDKMLKEVSLSQSYTCGVADGKDEKRLSKEVKLLLLGAGASGKSTV